MQVRLDLIGLSMELTPGDADYLPAGELEFEVALPVALEGERVVMRFAAVCLDDEVRVRPVEVDLVAVERRIHARLLEFRALERLKETNFTTAARPGAPALTQNASA